MFADAFLTSSAPVDCDCDSENFGHVSPVGASDMDWDVKGSSQSGGDGSEISGEVCASRCVAIFTGIREVDDEGRWTSVVDRERYKRGNWRRSMISRNNKRIGTC